MLNSRFLPAALVVCCVSLAARAQSVPCFEQNLGTNLGLGDDQLSTSQPLGFAFPFAGGSVTSVMVASNGFVWLGTGTGNGCCNGDVNAFLAGTPRVAPVWADLDPSSNGGVYFNALPGRAVITWDGIIEYGGGTTFTVQLQLVSDGSMVMYWDFATVIDGHTMLVGITPGGGAPNPGARDFSVAMPFDSGTTPTIFESFPASTFDLAGTAISFTPNGTGGYAVARRTNCGFATFATVGNGCPTAPSVYEQFPIGTLDLSGLAFDFTPSPGGGYQVTACTSGCIDPGYAGGNNLGLTDDSIARNLPLGFTFPFHGGSTTAIDVSSNGNVYLDTGTISGHRCCNGDPGQFLSEDASIAVLWQDLNPGAGGSVRTHQPNPSTFVVTFDSVPEYNAAGSANTAQLQLFADGRFRLAYGNVLNRGHACLVGFTPGNGAGDPGSYDLSSAVPFATGSGGDPLLLFAAAGSRPAIGSTFAMVVGHAPASALAGLMLWGFNAVPGGVSLDVVGMNGCRLYLTPDVTAPFAVQGAYSNVNQALPSAPSLVGLVIHAQSAVVAPGVNVAGVIVSNAARLQLGL